MRVLWVDDDHMVGDIIGNMIKLLGYKGDFAKNGEQALEYLDQNEYDLVITDIGMPGMDGWQLVDKIKEKFKGKRKVAVLTGWGSEVIEKKKQEHGVVSSIGILQKI